MTESNNEPLTNLDGIFNLPDSVTDPGLRMQYEIIVHRMKEEAKHVPMVTQAWLLIERIATFYIFMRQREMTGWANITPAQQKDMNTFWLAMTTQFQKMITKQSDAEVRESIYREIGASIKNVITKVEDPAMKKKLVELFEAEFQSQGL